VSNSETREILISKSRIHQLIVVFVMLCLATSTDIISGNWLLYTSFLFVVLITINFSGTDLIKSTIFLFVLNGLIRRLAASDSGYFTSNDVLILLPYVPIIVLWFKYKRESRVDNQLMVFLFFVLLLALLNIQNSPPNITWGIINLLLTTVLGQISRVFINDELLAFIARIGLAGSIYIFAQKISLPYFDLGWCLNRKTNLIILESCSGSSLRLWGTMESAVNMASFLTVCFFLVAFRSGSNIRIQTRIFQLLILFVAIFLTGTRTFIFILPLVFLFSAYVFKKISIPKAVFSITLVVIGASLLPSLALLFNYQDRWVDRLNIKNITGDQSLQDRFFLVSSFTDQVSLKNLLIGDGIGSKSRGLDTIDNGFLSLVLEIGLPLTLFFLYMILRRLGSIQNFANPLVTQCWSACFLLFLANFSFVVFTGSSSIYFWLLLFMIETKTKPRKLNSL
jgi:hypothetical protein